MSKFANKTPPKVILDSKGEPLVDKKKNDPTKQPSGQLELIFQIYLIQPILREPSGQLSSCDRLLGVVPQHF